MKSVSRNYDHIQALTLRGFSGHWMLFYLGAALNLLYLPLTVSTSNQDNQDDDWGEPDNNNSWHE